jgi:hypothetical protein
MGSHYQTPQHKSTLSPHRFLLANTSIMTAAPFPPSHHLQPCHTASTIACRSSEEFAALQPAGKGQYHLAITRRVKHLFFRILIFVRRQRCCCHQYRSPARIHLSHRSKLMCCCSKCNENGEKVSIFYGDLPCFQSNYFLLSSSWCVTLSTIVASHTASLIPPDKLKSAGNGQ